LLGGARIARMHILARELAVARVMLAPHHAPDPAA
jgi:hypothetical protein